MNLHVYILSQDGANGGASRRDHPSGAETIRFAEVRQVTIDLKPLPTP